MRAIRRDQRSSNAAVLVYKFVNSVDIFLGHPGEHDVHNITHCVFFSRVYYFAIERYGRTSHSFEIQLNKGAFLEDAGSPHAAPTRGNFYYSAKGVSFCLYESFFRLISP